MKNLSENPNIWYDLSGLLSYNRLFNFLIGNRSGGKTFSCKEWAIRDFLKNGKETVWVRRYKSEYVDLLNFFSDIAFKFPDIELEIKGKHGYINGKIFMYFLNLSVAQTYKSIPFPNVNKIIFDEFIIDKGALHYLSDDVGTFLELYSTVARTRNVRVIFIANAITVVNPYFLRFKIQPKKDQRYTTFSHNKEICIELYANSDFVSIMKNTKFGNLIKGMEYEKYAIDNEFLRDNDDFITNLPDNLLYYGKIKYLKNYYDILWHQMENKVYVVKGKFNPNKTAWAITTSDHDENTLLVKNHQQIQVTKFLKLAFMNGLVYYDSIITKNAIYDIMSLLSIH